EPLPVEHEQLPEGVPVPRPEAVEQDRALLSDAHPNLPAGDGPSTQPWTSDCIARERRGRGPPSRKRRAAEGPLSGTAGASRLWTAPRVRGNSARPPVRNRAALTVPALVEDPPHPETDP